MEGTLIALIASAVVVAVLLFAIIHFFPHASTVDKQKYQSRWLEIEKKLQGGDLDSRFMAILSADKLLDQALKETGSRGSTMGERMKARQSAWSNANAVWAAHKLRNQIAHDENVSVSEETARRALASFKKALRDLGAM